MSLNLNDNNLFKQFNDQKWSEIMQAYKDVVKWRAKTGKVVRDTTIERMEFLKSIRDAGLSPHSLRGIRGKPSHDMMMEFVRLSELRYGKE